MKMKQYKLSKIKHRENDSKKKENSIKHHILCKYILLKRKFTYTVLSTRMTYKIFYYIEQDKSTRCHKWSVKTGPNQ